MESERKDDVTSSAENRVKLTQLYEAIISGMSERYITRIIDRQSDVNLVIPETSIFATRAPELVGSTLLHFASLEGSGEAFDYLLSKRADYTVKNAAGSTALHSILSSVFQSLAERNRFHVDNSYVDAILAAHVRDENFANPRDKRGISHFHAACATNNATAAELFLQNGVSAGEAIHADSPVFPGYTPLHFVARCGGLETAEMLLRHDACVRVRDSTGATPLHVLVRKQLTLVERRNTGEDDDDDEFKENIERNERMMKLFLNVDDAVENAIVDDSGLTTFHIACTMLDTSLVEGLSAKVSDVNRSVKGDSAFWPGYTALHFAALCNVETVKLLLSRGADVEATSAEGTTPFDMCLKRYGINDIGYVISWHPIWRDIRFLDSQVKLVDFLNALYNTSKLIFMAKNFRISAQSSLPLDSPLWPGSTPLHLAVILFERIKARFHTKEPEEEEDDDDDEDKVIKLFLNKKYFEPIANVLAQDAYGRTPIHLAYRMRKRTVLNLLFERNDKTENPIDIDNVSLLHLACLHDRDQLIEELLFIGEDVNMPILADTRATWTDSQMVSAGSTPLHIAMLKDDRSAMKKLLSAGADPFAQDVNGITPIHLALASNSQRQSQIFVSSSNLINVAVPGGLTYLHIACVASDRAAVKKSIELGVDVNAPIGFELPTDCYSPKLVKLLTPYVGSTPLHLALQSDCLGAVEILLSRGADLFAKHPDEPAPIVQILRKKYTRYANVLLLNLRYNEAMQANLRNKTGLTLLQVACNALDVPLVRYLLDNGADVNAQARADSPVWPGCTPLHVLLENLNDRLDVHGSSRNRHVDDVYVTLKLLMSFGADVALTNADKKTAIDISKELYKSHIRSKTWLCTMLPMGDQDYYDLNFVDSQGISLFQEACHQNDLTVIEEFLKRGVDVNQQVDALSNEFAGYTPLHFAAKQRWQSLVGSSRHLATIELLLSHGADVRARDLYDNTPLHTAVQEGSNRQELISKLIEFGSDVSATNMYGRTPFEVLLRSTEASSDEVTVFLQNGARINTYNCITGVGCIRLIYESYDIEYDEVITAMIDNTPDLTEADSEGRTVIHNIVSCTNRADDPPGGLSSLCSRFVERGCDIDRQDKSGKTPLHTAVQWRNEHAVVHLLIMNANASIVDNDGKTALDYATEMCTCRETCEDSDHMRYLFGLQAFKLDLTGFQELSEYKDLKKINLDLTQHFRKLVKKAKKTYIIPDELTLYDFASETGAVSSYLHMPLLKREVVDEFFKSTINHGRFGEIAFWLKNHYGKALARPALIEPAKQSLNSLIGFPLPHLCSDSIFRFLGNVELKNLIAATPNDSNDT